jgi:hypothetical protein
MTSRSDRPPWIGFEPPEETTIPLREQCRVRRLFFFYHDIRAFTTSWLPQILFVTYRVCLALYLMAWLIVHAVTSSFGAHYLIFISQWSYIILTLNYLLWASMAVIYTIVAYFFKRNLKAALPRSHDKMTYTEYYRQDKTPWFIKIMWCLHNVAIIATVPVVAVYWAAEYTPGQTLEAASLHIHGVNLFLVLVDLVIARVPILLFHFFYPMIYALVYVIFIVVYWAAGGTHPTTGNNYIYSLSNFSDSPGVAAGTCVGIIIATGFVHFLFFLLAQVRDQIFKRLKCCFWNTHMRGLAATSYTNYEMTKAFENGSHV